MEKLREIFYDPETSTNNVRDLWLKLDKSLTQKQIREWLKKQAVNQVFQRPQKKRLRKVVGNTYNSYQIDLMFYNQYKTKNKHFVGLFTAINIVSRKAYAYPIKNRSLSEITRVFDKWLSELPEKPQVISSDNEKSFVNLYKKNDIKYFTSLPGEHAGKTALVDSFHRTLRNMINRYMALYKTNNYIDVLPKLMNNYNNSTHSSIKMPPNKVSKQDMDRIMMEARMKDEETKPIDLAPGQKVRTLKSKTIFDKAGRNFSKTVYTIHEKVGNKYLIKNPKELILKTPYAPENLLPIDDVELLNYEKPKNKVSMRKVKAVRRNKRLNLPGMIGVDKEGIPIMKSQLRPDTEKRIRKPSRKIRENNS